MNGFYFSDDGGKVDGSGDGRVIAQVELPPGYYIVFAKVELYRYENNPDGTGFPYSTQIEFTARLELGNIKDEFQGEFLKANYDPNDEDALITLNIAGEVKKTTHAKLVVTTAEDVTDLYFKNPRLSAIQVSELTISSGNLNIPEYVDHVDSQELLNAGMKTSNLDSFKTKKSGG